MLHDDGTGEIADLVALALDERTLHVRLVHCKYSTEATAGARVDDLYELCGQAQKSAAWRQDVEGMLDRLMHREGQRQRRGISGYLRGDDRTLIAIREGAERVRCEMEVVMVQPGLSTGRVSPPQLELLASTELYLRETAAARLRVVGGL